MGIVSMCLLLSVVVVSRVAAQRELEQNIESLKSGGYLTQVLPSDQSTEQDATEEQLNDWIRLINHFSTKSTSNFLDDESLYESKRFKLLPHRTMVNEFLSEHAKQISETVSLAQDNSPVSFPITIVEGLPQFPNHFSLLDVARTLVLESLIGEYEGNIEREYAAILAILGCATTIQNDPHYLGQSVSNRIFRMALRRVHAAVEGDRLSDEQLSQIRARIDTFRDTEKQFKLSVQGEILESIEKAKLSPAVGVSDWKDAWTRRVLAELGARERLASQSLNRLRKASDLQVLELRRFWAEARTNDQLLDQSLSGPTELYARHTPIDYGFSSLESIAGNLIRARMVADLAVLAIATRQFENAQGHPPSSLHELSPLVGDMKTFLTTDGELPRYKVVDASGSEAGSTTEILWTFDPMLQQKGITSEPPESSDFNFDLETGILLRWDLKFRKP